MGLCSPLVAYGIDLESQPRTPFPVSRRRGAETARELARLFTRRAKGASCRLAAGGFQGKAIKSPTAVLDVMFAGWAGGPPFRAVRTRVAWVNRAEPHARRADQGKHSEVFVAFDVAKKKHAVAIAESGRTGEVRFLGDVENAAKAARSQWTGSTNWSRSHLEERLLQPERLETILASVLDRRQERTERRREHLAELNKRITETDQRLNRLFNAIEFGVADLDSPGLKDRIAGLKALREQAGVDAERAKAALDNAGNQAVSPDTVRAFSRAARRRMRLESGGYRRDHLRALAQRIEVADTEVRIMGSKSELLRTLVAASGGKSVAFGVQSSVLKWRARQDSNLWPLPSEGNALSS